MQLISALKSRIKGGNFVQTAPTNSKTRRGIRRVVFEGGLGSQIIPFLEKNYLASMNIPFVVDASYFDINQKISHSRGRADHWSYKLDFYGIELGSLADGSASLDNEQEVSQDRNFDLWDSDFWSYVSKFGPNLLPINLPLLQDFKSAIGLSLNDKYSVVHVRRGDYLRVASHIVSDSMWLNVIYKIKLLTSSNLVITSDSEISETTKNKVSQIFRDSDARVIYLEGNQVDECILHDFMRSASVLVASNSTYSFSAAALSEPQTFCVVPSVFYGDKELEEINRGFRSSGDFFILKK
jgi:hypothetical protein